MIQIASRSNKTRAAERTPLLSLLQRASEGSALLVEVKSKAVKPPRKAAEPVRRSSKKQQGKKTSPAQPQRSASSAAPAAPQKPAERKPEHNDPVSGEKAARPAEPPKPVTPAVRQQQATQPPVLKLPEMKFTRPNGNGTNGNGAPVNGGSSLKDSKNGTNGINGANGTNGTNGINGHGAASQPPMFRPNIFSAMPAPRTPPTPPKASGLVQGPLEPDRPANQPNGSSRAQENGNSPVAERSPQQPRKPENDRVEQRPADPQRPAVPQRPAAPTLEQILRDNTGLPAQTSVLGVCDDGLPVLLDLNDPDPGAVVIIGDERMEQLEILHTAVASLAGRNSARGVQVLVFSCDPQPWQDWLAQHGFDRHTLAVVGVEDEDNIRDWVIQLADWTEQRRLGERSGPPVLLVMDTLSFLNRLEYDVRMNFEWMAKEGPAAAIWPIAAISTDLARMLSTRRMLRAFHTRILGYAENPADYIQIAGLTEQDADQFHRSGEFAVRVGEDWLRFRLPGAQPNRRR